MRFRFSTLVLFLLFFFPSSAQDNWTGIQQPVDVTAHAGKAFRYTPEILALIGAQVTKSDGQWGFFNNGGDQPVYEAAWATRSIEGRLDSGATTLNLGLVCMGNGSCSYDALQLQVETTPGQWQVVPLADAGFEKAALQKGVPAGWTVSKPSPHFRFGFSNEDVKEGTRALTITGAGLENNDAVTFMKGAAYAREHYNKQEYQVPMRDGTKLFTAVYVPKAASPTKTYPVMLHRTPYSVGPYGNEQYSFYIGPSTTMVQEGYIFVHQDVRGRYMSEGVWTNMTPHIVNKKKNDVDESTDTWDTIDWLLKNIQYHNGKVGQWGISYPGFYASAGSIDAHPALKATSPQAPVADFWFDDFHHNGAFTLGYFWNLPIFGSYKNKPSEQDWYTQFERGTQDSYDFYRRNGTLKALGEKYYKNNFLWQQLTTHPNYDTFWKARRIVDHLKNLKPAYLIVGGWFDAEDLYGPLATYKQIEKANKGIQNTIVMGPFGHGDWARETGHHMHHQVYFGDSIATFYQRNIEAKFFRHFLKESGSGPVGLPEAYMFNTGSHEWQTFDAWPSAGAEKKKLYLQPGERLRFAAPTGTAYSEYVSDPAKPVPYTMDIAGSFGITPRNYMSEDQRFAARRPDVLLFETDTLTEDLTLGGELIVKLNVSTTGTDADWVVKLIDVYPDNEPNTPYTPKGVTLGGYQQLVRSEATRSRWRNSFEKPEPMVPNKITPITFRLQDVLHTFKRGHRIMVQVQSTWFPLIDINPQKFVPNIYKAGKQDFIKAIQRVYHSAANPSYLEVDMLQ
jgi:putative CocE/NonD family hydrolase